LFTVTTTHSILTALALATFCAGCGGEPAYQSSLTRLQADGQAPPSPSSRLSAEPVEPVVSPREALRTESIDWDSGGVMRGLWRLKSNMRTTTYVHGIDVDVKRGHYAFDCSGMVDWLLRDSAPVAHRSLRQNLDYRPLARDFVNRVARMEPGATQGGWKRVARVADARPGDIIAWLKPKIVKSKNTGHVAVVIQSPRLRSAYDTAYLVRVADSSRLAHEDDSRNGRGGFGYGTILVETNPATGAPSGFSFAGSRASHAFGTKVVIGRPLK
jgi:hypothetical protein